MVNDVFKRYRYNIRSKWKCLWCTGKLDILINWRGVFARFILSGFFVWFIALLGFFEREPTKNDRTYKKATKIHFFFVFFRFSVFSIFYLLYFLMIESPAHTKPKENSNLFAKLFFVYSNNEQSQSRLSSVIMWYIGMHELVLCKNGITFVLLKIWLTLINSFISHIF